MGGSEVKDSNFNAAQLRVECFRSIVILDVSLRYLTSTLSNRIPIVSSIKFIGVTVDVSSRECYQSG